MFAGAQTRIPPFSTLLNFGERVKRSWEDARTAAPLPHAELLSFRELASQAKVPYETAVERLEARGFKGIRPEAIVQDLAQTNQVSAQRVYEIIQGQRGGGRGAGVTGSAKPVSRERRLKRALATGRVVAAAVSAAAAEPAGRRWLNTVPPGALP